MATKERTYENTVRRIKKPNGREFIFAWRGPPVGPKLSGEYGSEESRAAWHKAMAERHQPQTDVKTIKWLVTEFKASERWQGTASERKNYSQATKASYSHYLDRITSGLGDYTLAAFDRKEIRGTIAAWRTKNFANSPRNSDYAIAVLRLLLSFGIRRGVLDTNHAKASETLYVSDRSELIWEAPELAAIEACASTALFRAGKLASLTGIRQSDLIKLTWANILPDRIEFKTTKSKKVTTVRLPMYGELRDFLATIPLKENPAPADHILVRLKGDHKPWGSTSGFKSSWATGVERAIEAHPELKEKLEALHFHDFRGTAITRFAIAGFQPFEIAEFVGWKESAVRNLLKRYLSDSALWEARARRLAEPPVSPPANENAGKMETILETSAGNPVSKTGVF